MMDLIFGYTTFDWTVATGAVIGVLGMLYALLEIRLMRKTLVRIMDNTNAIRRKEVS